MAEKNAVKLQVPIAVTGADGTAKMLATLEPCRPKARHAKALFAALGPELSKAIFGEVGDTVDVKAALGSVLPSLFASEKLDAVEVVLADMCGISTKEFSDLDAVDMFAVVKAVISFFPALQSIEFSSSART